MEKCLSCRPADGERGPSLAGSFPIDQALETLVE
jgi:hypothetical protein